MEDKKTKKAKRRKNGEGTYGKKIIKGIEYYFYRKTYPELTTKNKSKDFTAKTLKDLQQKIKEFEDKLYLNEGKIEVVIEQTFLEYLCWFLDEKKKRKIRETTYYSYLDCIHMGVELFKDFDIANKQLNQINKTIIQKHIDALSEQYSLATIKRLYALITPALKFAEKKNYIVCEDLFDYEIPIEENIAVKKKEIVFLTEDDMRLIINEALRINGESVNGEKPISCGIKGTPYYGFNGFAIVLILALACRKGEALALRWKDIDFEKRLVRINKGVVRTRNTDKSITNKTIVKEYTPKTKSSVRTIPLNDIAILALNNIKKYNTNVNDNDIVCSGITGKRIQERNLRRTLDSIVKRSGCDKTGITLHGLRHSMTTYIIKKTGDIKAMSKILGHTTVKTTLDFYKHNTNEELLEVFNMFQLEKGDDITGHDFLCS